MSETPWLEIKHLYLQGTPPRDLAKAYPKVTLRQISNRIYREGWRKEREAFQQKATQEFQEFFLCTLESNHLKAVEAVGKILTEFLTQKKVSDINYTSLLAAAIRQAYPALNTLPPPTPKIIGIQDLDTDNI